MPKRALLSSTLVLVAVSLSSCDENPTGLQEETVGLQAVKTHRARTVVMRDLGFYGRGLAINDRGQIVGGSAQAFMWHKGERIDLGHTTAQGINNRGEVVGTDFEAWVWRDGVRTDLSLLEAEYSIAHDINEQGEIVGTVDTWAGPSYAILWHDGAGEYLVGCPSTSSAWGINNRGQVVGYCTIQGQTQAVRWHGTEMVILGPFVASGINNRGQIVGRSQNAAVVWERGRIIYLDSLGGLTHAFRINESGQIVGYSFDLEGHQHATTWYGGGLVDLGEDCTTSVAYDVNARGQIVGHCDERAVLWEVQ